MKEAEEILLTKYGITLEKKPDEKIRFILGKCNPVILIPGLYATRLVFTINCKKFIKENNGKQVIEARLYCQDTICADEENEEEEHVIFPALFKSPFTLIASSTNKYSGCLGYFEQFFNQKNECPKTEDGSDLCYYSDAVRVSYYGGTEQTEKEGQCGLKAIKNVVFTGISTYLDDIVNAGGSKVFAEMVKDLDKLGYSKGFSYGGVPQDFRRFTSTNKFALDSLKYEINRLYENTGKPVVIVSHSHGSIQALNFLIRTDEDLLKKIKKFVPITPPFAGASKLVDIFLHGAHEFDFELKIFDKLIVKAGFDTFGQSILYQAIPTIAELRPLSVFSSLMKDNKYNLFNEAIQERLELEKECRNKNCDATFIEEHSKIFSSIFSDLPSYEDEECRLDNSYDSKAKNVFDKPCRSEMHNQMLCPLMYMVNQTTSSKILEELCGMRNSSLLYNEDCKLNPIACLDSIYKYSPYPYENPKFDELAAIFNKKYSKKFNVTIDRSFFEDKETFQKKMLRIVDHHRNITLTDSLPIPPVDTLLVYSSVIPTKAAFIFNPKKEEQFTPEEILFKGGDGTVPNWSSYLTGLKWLYDKRINDLPQKITVVEYCSTLGKPGTKYAYDKTKEKDFYAIGCDCINDDFKSYKSYKSNIEKSACQHSTVLSDEVLRELIKDEAFIDKENLDNFSNSKKVSIINYNENRDYEQECNSDLRSILNNDI